MSRKPHQFIQNDVRFSALPRSEGPLEQGDPSGPLKRQSARRRGLTPVRKVNPPITSASTVGLYKTEGQSGCPNDVRILSNGCSFFITEAEYRRRECQPFFEDLPWHGPRETPTAGRVR